MIDFRYHLVSLISVFLALAVGIVLGAGPLKESIGDTLTGEVDTLRRRAADLRAELDSVSAELARTEDAWATVAPDLLASPTARRSSRRRPTTSSRVSSRAAGSPSSSSATPRRRSWRR